ncbi:nucleotidyltransferase [Acinetobacter gyllenbergii]|uniref:nucleotidyltransferase domain-containing protein n=1 Tax=Acinetobacter gyllenbergii TaxID=134534 RepID=UPI0021CFF260|nr:nucleotidyltransferase [Acinetobacter gyllenbergii]MCU4581179.1 nucleotidyltransferase [Acinetobacter gyllenbergii]
MSLISQHPTQIDSWELMLMNIVQKISLTTSQYQMITSRYDNLQTILNTAVDDLLKDAHIFVQGSIGLKTTIKPAAEAEGDMANVDADAIVLLPYAQNVDSKEVLETLQKCFQDGVRTNAPIKTLRRGIRIVYADENPGFHIDVTPARNVLGNYDLKGYGNLEVPDRETGWKCSTPRDYSKWLEDTSKLEIRIIRKMMDSVPVVESATQDPLPLYEEYIEHNPLRATIMLLKRHRDQWALSSNSPEYRPISAVITTLAAKAYERVVYESQTKSLRPIEAIIKIISYMPSFITANHEGFAVLNPKDSGENFAEKWNRPDGEYYQEAFYKWHGHALESVKIGLNDLGSLNTFEDKLIESFGVPRAFIQDVIKEIPKNWTLPGRSSQTTLNTLSFAALTGASSTATAVQETQDPVGRLG